jgi:hypothetical protein
VRMKMQSLLAANAAAAALSAFAGDIRTAE